MCSTYYISDVSAAEEAQKSVRGLEDSAVQAKYIELVRSGHIMFPSSHSPLIHVIL